MKTCNHPRNIFLICLILVAGIFQVEVRAATSPYVTIRENVPLNQATNDSINGVLPYFYSHTPLESGNIARLTDATSATSPTANVIPGPDNTWVGIAWDFGDPAPGYMWRLNRLDAWIAAADNLRRGYDADISVSRTGGANEFTVVTNSRHEADMTQNTQYNHVRYDFPATFVAGEDSGKDKYPVHGFRYLRLNSIGQRIDGSVDRQSRFVELDVWVTQVPIKITDVTRIQNGDISIVWEAIPARNYYVEYKSDLTQSGWGILNTVTADSETASITDTTIGSDQRFYRIVLQP